MLAVVYGLEKFHHYAYGRDITVITDHKPLVSINQKTLSKAPKRLQSLLLRIQGYNMKLLYKQGKTLIIADALSRNPLNKREEVFCVNNIRDLPLKRERFEDIRIATNKDDAMCQLKYIIANGWPEDKENVPSQVKPYFHYRDEMTVEDGIILRDQE